MESKRVVLVRHFQSTTNTLMGRCIDQGIAYVDSESQRDAKVDRAFVTDEAIAAVRAAVGCVDAIAVSPLTRAIETAELVFGAWDVPRVVLPEATERVYSYADVRTPTSEMRARYPQWDWSRAADEAVNDAADDAVDDNAVEFRTHGMYTIRGEMADPFARRMDVLRATLRALPYRSVVLVTHRAVMAALTGGTKVTNGAVVEIVL